MPASKPQTITVSLDIGELFDNREYKVLRKDVDRGGAPGVFDGSGSMTVRVNNQPLVLLHMRENADGHAALEVYGLAPGKPPKQIADVDLESIGLVPERQRTERTS